MIYCTTSYIKIFHGEGTSNSVSKVESVVQFSIKSNLWTFITYVGSDLWFNFALFITACMVFKHVFSFNTKRNAFVWSLTHQLASAELTAWQTIYFPVIGSFHINMSSEPWWYQQLNFQSYQLLLAKGPYLRFHPVLAIMQYGRTISVCGEDTSKHVHLSNDPGTFGTDSMNGIKHPGSSNWISFSRSQDKKSYLRSGNKFNTMKTHETW